MRKKILFFVFINFTLLLFFNLLYFFTLHNTQCVVYLKYPIFLITKTTFISYVIFYVLYLLHQPESNIEKTLHKSFGEAVFFTLIEWYCIIEIFVYLSQIHILLGRVFKIIPSKLTTLPLHLNPGMFIGLDFLEEWGLLFISFSFLLTILIFVILYLEKNIEKFYKTFYIFIFFVGSMYIMNFLIPYLRPLYVFFDKTLYSDNLFYLTSILWKNTFSEPQCSFFIMWGSALDFINVTSGIYAFLLTTLFIEKKEYFKIPILLIIIYLILYYWFTLHLLFLSLSSIMLGFLYGVTFRIAVKKIEKY